MKAKDLKVGDEFCSDTNPNWRKLLYLTEIHAFEMIPEKYHGLCLMRFQYCDGQEPKFKTIFIDPELDGFQVRPATTKTISKPPIQ